MAMLDGTDPALLFEWLEYSQIEPFGEFRADIRNALLCHVIVNAMGAKKKGGGSFNLEDFMITFDAKQKPLLDPEHVKNMMKKRYGNHRKSGR